VLPNPWKMQNKSHHLQTTNNKKNRKQTTQRCMRPQSFTMTNCPLSWHFLLVQILAAVHALGYFIIQILIWPLFTLRNTDTTFLSQANWWKIVFRRILFCRFHPGLQIGSFPSPGKPLGLASHTSPTSWMCMVHSLDVPALFLIQFIKSDRFKNTLIFASEWLSGTQILVNICRRKVISGKGYTASIAHSWALAVYHQFSLKSIVQNRGLHLLTSLLV
jgi:hypothetical protein